MRTPDCDPPELVLDTSANLVTQEREYRLITPLFGGGVRTAEADPITTVRVSEVRGQLRFWWRATRGRQFGTLAALRDAEELLWGAASTPTKPRPAQVQIALTLKSEGITLIVKDEQGRALTQRDRDGRDQPMNPGNPSSPYGYGAFPLNSRAGAELRDGVHFTLAITFPDRQRTDVEAALWAWETFGGLGGRTRRGFGALTCDRCTEKHADMTDKALSIARPEPTPDAVRMWMTGCLQQHVSAGHAPQNVPHLSQQLVFAVTRQPQAADTTLRHLFRRLKEFRQQRQSVPKLIPRGSNQTGPVPDRNRWPEPDAIRKTTKSYANYTDAAGNLHDHRTPLNQVNGQPVQKYPRAAFGLPIIFKFKDTGDPPDQYTLTAKDPKTDQGYDRFASPLIIRPLECNGGKCVGLAVLLEGTRLPDNLLLVTNGGKIENAETDLTQPEAHQIKKTNGEPLLPNNPAGITANDILRAFLNFL